jgi:hypothetical protein
MLETRERFDGDEGPVRISNTLDITGDWRAEPLKVISGVTESIKALEGTMAEAVRLARRQGITWEEIGKALGVSRQSAWERFSTD